MEKTRDTWATPLDFYTWVDKRWKPSLDVCASAANTKCPSFITREQNAFHTPWNPQNKVAWCNPPGSEVSAWIPLCAQQATEKGLTVICLVQAGVGSTWFREYHRRASTYLLTPRVQFVPPKGIKKSSNSRDYMLMEFGPSATGYIWVCKWK